MSEMPMSPARFGSGIVYAVWMNGMTDDHGAASPEILASESTMQELYAEANATDQILKFDGILVDGVLLADGRPQKMLVGVGRAPIEGTLVRYHDHFTGAVEEDDEDGEPQAPEPPRTASGAPSPFRVS